MKSSRTRYAKPITVIKPPPTMLSVFSGCNNINQRGGVTYMRDISSTFMAGNRVKVLIAKHEKNHKRLKKRWDCKNEIPNVIGQNAPRTNRPVRTSR
jgi:hypothetical protein